MRPETDFAARIRPEQVAEIQQSKRLRDDAVELQSRVSGGSYDDQDLARFWGLAAGAGIVLRVSSSQLAERAGLGNQFFVSVARDRRRPKLENFLRALRAIIEVANERLRDIDQIETNTVSGDAPIAPVAARTVLQMVTSLGQLARKEIEAIDRELPNDPDRIEINEKLRALLVIFADGFDRISAALTTAPSGDTAKALKNVASISREVGSSVNAWFKANAVEAVDWGMRLPVMVAGVAGLGWAGADMTVATSAVAAIVGGQKVADILSKRKTE